MYGLERTYPPATCLAAGGTHHTGGVYMLDAAEMRFYALLGCGLVIFTISLYFGVPIEQVLMILAAFGLGGALPSPLK